MKHQIGCLIDSVSPGSPAAEHGIKPGWRLVRIDNQPISDIIEYKIIESDQNLRLLIQDENGLFRRIRIKKPIDQPLGLTFNPPTISKIDCCGNNCIFCFIEQNPPGLRPSLYVKDDDYRLSFLYGNFITLNRLNDIDIERIVKLQLSPLYVSVHTTNPSLRRAMFRTNHADRGLDNLKRLVKAGIRVHAQIVLCPGYNTGPELERTIRDLDLLGQNITDIAVVPVGLTAHRSNLTPLRKFTSTEAKQLIENIDHMQLEFIKNRKTRFVFPADEFYVMAGYDFPADQYYENYAQLENGVGLSRLFLNELETLKKSKKPVIKDELAVTVVSGKAASRLIQKLAEEFNSLDRLHVEQVIAENYFFGEQVNVSGLLSGSDLSTSLEGEKTGKALFITDSMLNEKRTLFLDGMQIGTLEHNLKTAVHPVSGPREMLQKIIEITSTK